MQLMVGDVLTLVVNLKEQQVDSGAGQVDSGAGPYGEGTLWIEVNDRPVNATGWKLPIIGITHKRYHAVAAVRTPGVCLTFLGTSED